VRTHSAWKAEEVGAGRIKDGEAVRPRNGFDLFRFGGSTYGLSNQGNLNTISVAEQVSASSHTAV